jgi:UDP:flavonoid glycosyltransferase YjiC (YdhE family)
MLGLRGLNRVATTAQRLGLKVVLVTQGTFGDVHPFIALALRLKSEGYHPVVAVSERYGRKVKAEGLAFHAVRPDASDHERDLGIDDKQITERLMGKGVRGLEFVVRSLSLPYLSRTFADVMVATEDAALVVTSSFAFAATIAAEHRGLPWVNVVLQPLRFMSAYDPPSMLRFSGLRTMSAPLARGLTRAVLHALDRRTAPWAQPIHALRSELGLPPAHGNPLMQGQYSPYATLGLYSKVLGQVQPDFPPRTTVTGFAFYDSREGGVPAIDSELDEFLKAGPPPVVLALGSQAVFVPGTFYEEGLSAISHLGLRAVLVGAHPGESLSFKRSSDVFVTPYAPYSDVFARCAAIVHHGGIGTTGQALRAGRPQLLIPFWGDQPDNAARIVRLGVGRAIRRSQCTATRVATELKILLEEEQYASRAMRNGQEMTNEGGAEAAVNIIGNVLRSQVQAHRPSPSTRS